MKKNCFSFSIIAASLFTFFNSPAQCPPQPLPITISGGPAHFICPGESVTLTANGAVNCNWSNGATSPVVVVSPTATAQYTVTGGNQQGCPMIGSVTVQVNVGISASYYVYPFVPAVAGNSAVCNAGVVLLTGLGAASYTWNGTQQAATLSIVSPTVATAYTLSASNGQGCLSTMIQTLTPIPGTVNISAPAYACQGSPVIAAVLPSPVQFPTGSPYFSWYENNSNLGNNYTVAITPTSTSVYTLMNSLCNISQTFSIVYIPIDLQVSATNYTMCSSGGSATLTASGANTYTWAGIDNSPQIVVSPSTTTIYTVSGSSTGNQCVQTQNLYITVYQVQYPSFTISSTSICLGDSITIDGWGGYGGWEVSDGVHYPKYSFDNNDPFHVTYIPTVATTYTIRAIPDDENPCPGGEDYVTVIVGCDVGIKEQAANDNSITIFPNPASGIMTIYSPAFIYSIVVTDITGRVVLKKEYDGLNKSEELSMTQLNSGVYLIRADNGRATKIFKE